MSSPEHRGDVGARSFESDSRTTQTIRRQVGGDEDADDAGSIAGISSSIASIAACAWGDRKKQA